MGFKRASDGRVFFQGVNETANDDVGTTEDIAEQMDDSDALLPRQSHAQLQVLSLLKSLNDRLKTTQAERDFMRRQLEDYRGAIEELEQKADHSAQAFKSLEQKISSVGTHAGASPNTEEFLRDTLREMEKTRRVLLNLESKAERADETIAAISRNQQEQSQKIARAVVSYNELTARVHETEDTLNAKIDDTLNQQRLLAEKIDQTIEDRARFMRKIERIEETVIQTRDALNARALSLSARAEETSSLGEMLAAERAFEAQSAPLEMEQKPRTLMSTIISLQGAMIPGLFFAAIVAGVIIGNTQSPQQSMPDMGTLLAPKTATIEPAAPATQETTDWSVESDTSAFTTPAAPEESAAPFSETLKNLGLPDQSEMTDMIEKAPEKLATALNDLVVGETQETLETPASAPEAAEDIAPVPEAQQPVEAITVPLSDYKPAAAPDDIPFDSSLPEAIQKVEEQAMAGVPEAQHDLAAIYIAGHGGVKQDYERAAMWFRKAADKGIANARYNLGVLHHQGLGTEKNMREALYWYDSAAALGHTEAQYNLGIAYIEGIGVSYDPKKAEGYFEAAAKAGMVEAAYNLGLIYENGLLGEPKPDAAIMWYKQAADKGSPEAKAALNQLSKALGVSTDDINRVADDMKTQKETPVAKPETIQPKPAPAVAEKPIDEDFDTSEISDDIIVSQLEPVVMKDDGTIAAVEQEFLQMLTSQIQGHLMKMGLYPGPADGRAGPLTTDAIRSYQNAHGLEPNGKASAELLDHMTETAAGE